MQRAFRQVDVFGSEPLLGNPVAVVLDGDGLTDEQMLAFTRWMNLSETTFILPPTAPAADYRVRIFTLSGELPFAGHPTLGTCHAWLEAGGTPKDPAVVVQECGVGRVRVRRGTDALAFAAPPLQRSGPLADDELARACRELGIGSERVVDAAWVDNGPGWMALLVDDAELLRSLDPTLDPSTGMRAIGVAALTPGAEAAYELRAFITDANGRTMEDPVTGSLNASLAQWMLASGRASAPYVAAQGMQLGRAGRIAIDADGDTTWVGGSTVTVVSGAAEL